MVLPPFQSPGDDLEQNVHLASPRVHLPGNVQCQFTDQLYADDLLVADSPLDLQTALNTVHRWGVSVPLQIWRWPHQISSDGVRARRRLPDLDVLIKCLAS